MKKLAAALGTALLIQGCAYAISPHFTRQADTTITFAQLLADPDLFKGRILILGGVIAGITPVQNRGTLIGVLQKPLDYWGKPVRTTRIGGRFLLYEPRVLDVMLYAPGREITVAAEVAGTKLEALGKEVLTDPILVVKEMKLWEKPPRTLGPPQWGDPLFDRYGQPGRPE